MAVAACQTAAPTPPPECQAVWSDEAAREVAQGLASATGSARPVWHGYDLGDGSYVVHAGPSDSGTACLGLWRDGRAVAFASLAAEPALLTPLYGYYFAPDWHGSPDEAIIHRATQPPAIRAWLEGLGVESAVILPVNVQDFPIELSAFDKLQVAIHEGFHLFVQAPRWYASTGPWPAWDRQPDRAGVRACYSATQAAEAAIQEERATLVQLVDHLLDGDSAGACRAGATFLARRRARYAMLADVRVARADGTPTGCREAEALMELEEGTADYASWTVLYDLGQTSRERLRRRYQAMQNDMYYLTGAMQLHAMQLMAPAHMQAVIDDIIDSPGLAEGSQTSVLDRTLAAYCR
jgi:hypothetical protein